MDPRPAAFAALLLLAIVLAPLSAAQVGQWHGQDNEFGSIRTPYAATMQGSRVSIEAKVVLSTNYAEKDSRWFMFGFTVEHTPLDLTFDNLIRADTGEEMPCYQRQGDATSALKCFVDLRDMPRPGTEIILRGSVGSPRTGNFQVGAMVLPFTYAWEKVAMSNGLPAELYGTTQMNVMSPTTGKAGALHGMGNKIPAPGLAISLGSLGLAAVLVAANRRRR